MGGGEGGGQGEGGEVEMEGRRRVFLKSAEVASVAGIPATDIFLGTTTADVC